jgi:hypothetical protein
MSKYIKSFNEALGVANSTLFYVDRLSYIAIEEFYRYIDDTRSEGMDYEDMKSVDITIPYRQILRQVPPYRKNDYYDFPLYEIKLTIHLSKRPGLEIKNDAAKSDYSYGYKIGGYASPFALGNEKRSMRFRDAIKQNVNHTLSIHLGLEMLYDYGFKKISTNFPQFEKTHLFKKVHSVISHELNHIYEYYNRKLSDNSKLKISMTWASIGDNVYGVDNTIFNFWQSRFSEHIYNSESHEINAQSQEAKTYVDRLSFDRFRNTYIWKNAKSMQNWTYDKFKRDFELELKKLSIDEDIDSFLKRMKDIFCKEYAILLHELDEEPSIDPSKLNSMSIDKFFTFFEKRFKESGTRLIKNYCRLYSLSKN